MKKLIVIVGITGNQGGSVARAFLGDQDWAVRGTTRNPSKASNQALKDAGAELVAADLDDVESLVKAFSGASAIYGVTDFWQFIEDDKTKQIATEKDILINQAAYGRELQQAKNIIDAVATVGTSLERFTFSSLANSKKWSGGSITFNYHFDAKADAVDYLAATHPELAKKTCYLQVGYYMMNTLGGFFAPKKQENGTYLLRMPYASNPKPLPWVHPPNDTGRYVQALLKAPAGSTMLGFSTKATMPEFCALWTKIMQERGLIGSDIQCIFDGTMTVEECEKRIPGGLGREIGETCIWSSKYGFDGSDPDVKEPAYFGVATESLTSLESYIRSQDWSSIL